MSRNISFIRICIPQLCYTRSLYKAAIGFCQLSSSMSHAGRFPTIYQGVFTRKGRREESEFSRLLSSSRRFAKVFHARGIFQPRRISIFHLARLSTFPRFRLRDVTIGAQLRDRIFLSPWAISLMRCVIELVFRAGKISNRPKRTRAKSRRASLNYSTFPSCDFTNFMGIIHYDERITNHLITLKRKCKASMLVSI